MRRHLHRLGELRRHAPAPEHHRRRQHVCDIAGDIVSLGHNLIGSTSDGSGFRPDLGDQLNVNPLLGPLQDNGGPTFTCALLPGSPAIDAGDNTDAPLSDQRGFTRIVNGTIDIGAYELQTASTVSTTTTLTSSPNPSDYYPRR